MYSMFDMQLLFVYFSANLFALVAGRIATITELHKDLSFVNSSSQSFLDAAGPALGVTGDPSPPDPDQVWHKAYCRGAALLKAMSLEEHDSSVMLEWPYTESPWDGDLEAELRTWGYLDDDDHHAESDESCNFAGPDYEMQKAFDALGFDPRSADMGGPNHCFNLRHGFGPAVILDKDGKMPPLAEQRYEVDAKTYRVRHM